MSEILLLDSSRALPPLVANIASEYGLAFHHASSVGDAIDKIQQESVTHVLVGDHFTDDLFDRRETFFLELRRRRTCEIIFLTKFVEDIAAEINVPERARFIDIPVNSADLKKALGFTSHKLNRVCRI